MTRSRLKDGRSLFESLVKGVPAIIARDRVPEMEAKLRELVLEAPFDIIHADQTSMAYYGLFARSVHQADGHPFIILDQHNALYLVVQRQSRHVRSRLKQLSWRREANLLQKYEAALLSQYDEVLAVTANDKEALLCLLPDAEAVIQREQHITVVPICVDPSLQPQIKPIEEGLRILHLGTMFWPPNVEGVLWFAEQILPHVLREIPDVTFTIAGKNPPPEVMALAGRLSPVQDHVEVTGFVPDPTNLIAASRVFVVPLLAGGGMRVKILDAWQWGLPMVSTTIGAEGILSQPGENILLADDPQEFAAAVVRILQDRQLADKLRINGRSWVETHYDWRQEYRRVDEVYGRRYSVFA
jgi:glycosyltransferase involved in cell wall biosynthesis